MNFIRYRQKYLSTCLVATAALIGGVSSASAQVPLGAAAPFTVLGGTAVTCTGGAVVGEVGISPGITASYTNTGCAVKGSAPPATNAAAVEAREDFLSAYAALELKAASWACTQVSGNLAGENLAPGDYCLNGVAKTGLLTLRGPSNGVWIFLVNGALTGTNFHVVMAGGGQPCNVFWAPSRAASLTTSTLKGNILAGNAVGGSVTLTGGALTGRVLAKVAVTTTGTSIVGCQAHALSALSAVSEDQ
jgi:ice-binding like protein